MTDTLHSTQQTVCVPNISATERRKRLLGGVIGLVLSVAVLTMLSATNAAPVWRLVLFPLLFGAAVGYFQAREKT